MRPTMSQAANKDHFKGLLIEYLENKLDSIVSKLKDPSNRTNKTLLQQCKMFDSWIAEMEED